MQLTDTAGVRAWAHAWSRESPGTGATSLAICTSLTSKPSRMFRAWPQLGVISRKWASQAKLSFEGRQADRPSRCCHLNQHSSSSSCLQSHCAALACRRPSFDQAFCTSLDQQLIQLPAAQCVPSAAPRAGNPLGAGAFLCLQVRCWRSVCAECMCWLLQ
jgi:hypothetical protein